jgi:hypothetical protein
VGLWADAMEPTSNKAESNVGWRSVGMGALLRDERPKGRSPWSTRHVVVGLGH